MPSRGSGEQLPQYGPELGTAAYIERNFRELSDKIGGLVDLLTSQTETVRKDFSGNTDSSGNADLPVKVAIPAGYEFSLHRLIIDDGVGTFAATTTGGSYEIQVNRERIDGGSLATVGLPAVWSASSSAGIFLRGGDELNIHVASAGAHSKKIFGVAQGKMRRIRVGE